MCCWNNHVTVSVCVLQQFPRLRGAGEDEPAADRSDVGRHDNTVGTHVRQGPGESEAERAGYV